MCENMTICVKILLSFYICVKIWLFLKCVQFLKSCLQFLMDTILNPAIAQFLMKKKGDATMKRVSRILINGGARCGGVSPLYFICKKYLQIILHGILLAPTHSMTFGTHTRTYVCQWSLCRPGARSTTWSTSCVTSLKHLDCRGFKSW
jgi:hypothetical protein